MHVLRAPDDRFAELPGSTYTPRYVEVGDGEGGEPRVAVVDEGPADGETVLLLHGEPSWSFLYRRVVPVVLDAAGGDRVFQRLAPGAQGQPHVTLAGGGHFLQEDVGPEPADVVAGFVAATR